MYIVYNVQEVPYHSGRANRRERDKKGKKNSRGWGVGIEETKVGKVEMRDRGSFLRTESCPHKL